METAEIIRNSVTNVDSFCTFLRDSEHLLWFIVYGQTYHFKALQFGLATASPEFTGVVKEEKLVLQSRGIRIHQYLDHWLFMQVFHFSRPRN